MKHPHAYKYIGEMEGGMIGFGFVSPDKIVIAHSEQQQQVVDNAGSRYFTKFGGNITADNFALMEGQTFSNALIDPDSANAEPVTADAPATQPDAAPDTEATK